jgi:hypothetical protein
MTNGFVWRGVPPPVFDRVDVDGEVPVGWGQSCRVGTAHRSRGAPASGVRRRTPSHPTSHSNPRRKSPWFPISPHHSLFVQRLCVAPGGRVLLRTIEVGGVGVPGIANCGVDLWVRGVPFRNPCEGSRAWRRTGSEDGIRGTRCSKTPSMGKAPRRLGPPRQSICGKPSISISQKSCLTLTILAGYS